MIDPDSFFFFLGASLLLLVAPGPAILYVVAESLDKGRRSGVIASTGLSAGILVHVAGATVGLSALLATSALTFSVLKYAGAAYLVFLGIRQLRDRWLARSEPQAPARQSRPSVEDADPWSSFRRGLVVNILNPKIALFFLAFFPQFVDPTRGSATLQLLSLGLVFALLTLLVDVSYALAAGTAADLARRRWAGRMGALARAGGYLPGAVYIGLGVAAALAPVERR